MVGKFARATLRIGSWGVGAGIILLSVSIGLALINLWTYQRLTHEVDIGVISFHRVGDQRFIATLTRPADRPLEFLLRGDDWQVDARMIKWVPWFTLLGRDPLYRLERISGRFSDVADARTTPLTIYRLSENPGLDLWALVRRHADWLPWVDAVYGSAVYLPMVDGLSYKITLGPSGLIARPLTGNVTPLLKRWNSR